MNEMKLYEGINEIDDDLIDEAEAPACKPKFYTSALSAAAVFLILGVTGTLFSSQNVKYSPDENIIIESAVTSTAVSGTSISSTCQISGSTVYTTVFNEESTSAQIYTNTNNNTETAAAPSAIKTAEPDDAAKRTNEISKNTVTSVVNNTTKASKTSKATVTTTARKTDNTPKTTVTVATTSEIITTTQPVTTADDDERNAEMKKNLSIIISGLITAQLAVCNAPSATAAEYTDPALKYNPSRYYESCIRINPAEQELFDMIDAGTIDIDIDRNGELDMRDAELLYSYDLWKFINANDEYTGIYKDYYNGRNYKHIDPGNYKGMEFEVPSEEAMNFLETRPDIRNKEFFMQSKEYSPYAISTLDSNLLIRYHLTHTFKEDYRTSKYYTDNFSGNSWALDFFLNEVELNKKKLNTYVIGRSSTELEPFYDVNGDGVFDLHDAQDYYLFCKATDYENSGITKETWNNCQKLWEASGEYFKRTENISYHFSFKDMIDLAVDRVDFQPEFIQSEYYTNERPNNENMYFDHEKNIYIHVRYAVEDKDIPGNKLSFEQNAFTTFYDEWSKNIGAETLALLDIDGNGVLNHDDMNYTYTYSLELYGDTPSENTELPADIRKLFDEEFDINGNGLSGDASDIMAAEDYISLHDGLVIEKTQDTNCDNVDKTAFDGNTFDTFYDTWSKNIGAETLALLDIDGNGILDKNDNDYAHTYALELFGETPSENTNLPADIRKFFDEEFDLNGNGLSGDAYDIEAAETYIYLHEGLVIENVQATLCGDANCDNKVKVSDSVAILQSLGNSDKYGLSESGILNADVYNPGDGITPMDALTIQKLDSGVITSLPEMPE